MPISLTIEETCEVDLNKFEGKPAVLIYIASNIEKEKTEIELQMPINWNMKDLVKTITQSLHHIDGIVTSVHVKSLTLDTSKLN